jgi:hypothetical protein
VEVYTNSIIDARQAQGVSLFSVHANQTAGYAGRDLVGRRGHSRWLESLRVNQGVDANQSGMPTIWLREVLADQSDRGYRAKVRGRRAINDAHGAILLKRHFRKAAQFPAVQLLRPQLTQNFYGTHANSQMLIDAITIELVGHAGEFDFAV